jgi:hypothetical protein
MEQRTNSPYPRLDKPVLAVIGVLLILSCVLFLASERAHDWPYYQGEFRRLVAEKFGEDKASAVPSGTSQIWVPGLGRADRCVTCHQATAWKGFESAEEPFRTHPVEPLRLHPRKFGYVVPWRTGLGARRVGLTARWRTGRSRCSVARSVSRTRSRWTRRRSCR